MKAKRIPAFFAFVLAAMLLFSVLAFADMGPKPSVVLSFTNSELKGCYVTLMSKEISTGPHSYQSEPSVRGKYSLYGETDEMWAAYLAFREYDKTSELYFLEYFRQIGEELEFRWGYYPPQSFTILIYNPENGSMLESERLERYAFDSYFGVTPDESGLKIEKAYNYVGQIATLVARIVLTLAVEIALALPFALKRRRLLTVIIIANVVTQIALNLWLNSILLRSGEMMFILAYIGLELLVFLAEAVFYAFTFGRIGTAEGEKKLPGFVAPVYALVANAASFAVGMLLSAYLPQLF